MKSTISITVDVITLQKCKDYQINISGSCNDFLNSLILRKEQDVSKINFQIEKKKLDSIQDQISRLQADYMVTEAKLKKFEEIEKTKEIKKLEDEKKEIEKQTKCHNCGTLYGENYPFVTFNKTKICKTCFRSSNNEQVKRWESATD
jgi:formylmethanofuran dehydrogenase subunit E